LPARNEINRQYQLVPNTTVEISLIAPPVEIETISGQSVEILLQFFLRPELPTPKVSHDAPKI
jgi:hypothetical protein